MSKYTSCIKDGYSSSIRSELNILKPGHFMPFNAVKFNLFTWESVGFIHVLCQEVVCQIYMNLLDN